MSNLAWIHPNDEFWHYGTLGPDGKVGSISDKGYGTVQHKEAQYMCFALNQKMQIASDLESAKAIVESMLK